MFNIIGTVEVNVVRLGFSRHAKGNKRYIEKQVAKTLFESTFGTVK